MNEHDSPGGELFPRRRLIRDASLLTGAAAAATLLGARPSLAGSAPSGKPVITLHQATPSVSPVASPVDLDAYAPVNLTANELTTLKAALDRIIPADDLGPGANEMGVFVFIDRWLSRPPASALTDYQTGLAALDTAAGAGGFAAADAAKQDEILTNAEAGTLTDAPAGFFATLLNHTRMGMFSDPMYGGNVDFAGWDLIGYSGVKLSWTAEDQALDVLPKPEHISVQQYGGTPS
jgi:gluconate 2-dehydrogenase gamma chain